MKRFWDKVKKSNGCWEWTAGKCKKYGKFKLDGKMKSAHRVAWQLINGDIPKGMYVCHICDNPSCVNPNHLFIGTQTDNMHDMKSKGRSNKGEARWSSKLKEEDIDRIRATKKPQQEIAECFGITQAHVSRIKSGQKWAHK